MRPTLIIAFAMLFSLAVAGQTSQKKEKSYPLFTLLKIRELEANLKLSQLTKQKIADYLASQEILANAELEKGTDIRSVAEFVDLPLIKLKAFLNQTELLQYSTKVYGDNSPIIIALKWSKQLSLTSVQSKELWEALSKSEQDAKIAKTNKDILQTSKVKGCLNSSQFSKFLDIVYSKKAYDSALENTASSIKFKLISSGDSVKTFQQLLAYETGKQRAIKMVFEKNGNLDSINEESEINKPFILYKLDLLTGKLPKSDLADVLKYKDQVGISEALSDSLLKLVRVSRNTNFNYKYKFSYLYNDTQDLERKRILRMLDSAQLSSYLKFRNLKYVNDDVSKDLAQISSFKIAQPLDTKKLYEQLYSFHLADAIYRDVFKFSKQPIDGNRQRSFAANKPIYLYKLDAYRNSLPSSEYNNILKYSNDLNLNESQFDSLISAVKDYEIQRALYYQNEADFRLFPTASVYAKIKEIVSKEQLERYFNLKGKADAIKSAMKSWHDVNYYKLQNQLGKDESLLTFKKYFMKEVAANERLKWYPGHESELLKAGVLTERPSTLIKVRAYSGDLKGSLIGDIVAQGRELALTTNQVDSLINYQHVVDKLNVDFLNAHETGKFYSKRLEYNYCGRILTTKQIFLYSSIKFRESSNAQALDLIEKLHDQNIPILNPQKTSEDLKKYYLNVKIAEERYNFFPQQEFKFASIRAKANKPVVLKQLEEVEHREKVASVENTAW